MAEEPQDVVQAETETAPESSTEDQQTTESDEKSVEEPVDESGVPLKNRVAEKERKLKAKLSQLEAQEALLKNDVEQPEMSQDEAIETVRRLAREEQAKLLEPVLAKQFLLEHPDAADMIEEINAVRARHPELKNIDKLDVAYKVAKAEKQDEIIRQRVESETRAKNTQQQQASQAAVEGTGKVKAPASTMADKINQASSLKELQALEQELLG